MNVFLAVTLWGALSGARAFTSTTTSTMPSDGFVGAGTTPACLASLFEQALVTATCHQGKAFVSGRREFKHIFDASLIVLMCYICMVSTKGAAEGVRQR